MTTITKRRTSYYHNGVMAYDHFKVDGLIHGEAKSWDTDGTLTNHVLMFHGTGIVSCAELDKLDKMALVLTYGLPLL